MVKRSRKDQRLSESPGGLWQVTHLVWKLGSDCPWPFHRLALLSLDRSFTLSVQVNVHEQCSGPFWKQAGKPQGSLVVSPIPWPLLSPGSGLVWAHGTWRLITLLKLMVLLPPERLFPFGGFLLFPVNTKIFHCSPSSSPSQRPPSTGSVPCPLSPPFAAPPSSLSGCSQPGGQGLQ